MPGPARRHRAARGAAPGPPGAHLARPDTELARPRESLELFHAIELAEVAPQIVDRKVVLLVSAQWFTPQGQLPAAYAGVFSASQWVALSSNTTLSPATRADLLARGRSLASAGVRRVPGVDELALRPVVLREKARARTLTSRFTDGFEVAAGAVPAAQIDWAQARREADKLAIKESSSNGLGFNNGRWKKIAGSVAKGTYRNAMANLDYAGDSPSWGDLQLFLDVARETGTEVLLVDMPMNGKWYDHQGYDKARRARYYERLRSVAEANKVQLADFSDKEYERGFMWDGTHLGWKGWLDVTQACERFSRS